MFYSRKSGMVLRGAGDLSSADFGVGDFTQDSNEHDLDISSKVPANAKWVFCRFTGTAMNFTYTFNFKPYGYSNGIFIYRTQQKVAATIPEINFWLPVLTDKKLVYWNGGGAWIIADLSILAWMI